jgi:NADPH-dependent 2,4-dienoyl-CoA reductase/sulfur reductase-like enzyme/nitrite reductase/ring-hydroxylating ferredoxin subunit
MGDQEAKLSGPDLTQGVEISAIPESDMLLGHVAGEPVLLVRRAHELFAIGAVCTHYGAPLIDGRVVDGGIRCPWHHACFSLKSGRAIRAPALAPEPCWRVERRNGRAYVKDKLHTTRTRHRTVAGTPASVIIVGGGAAGNAAAEELRKEGYSGQIRIFSADLSLPCDRPNLSKGYLAGAASDESNFLRSPGFYKDQEIELHLGARVSAIDVHNERVQMADGSSHSFGALLLATGAEPVHLDIPGANLPHVHYLRTVHDSHELVAKALSSKRAVVIGASFIGLEVAASLRSRGLDVDVVGLEAVPMERVLGAEVGRFIRKLHEEHGVTFHLGTTAVSIDGQQVKLRNGEILDADLVVIGIGVRPEVGLAQRAGLAVDRGVLVDKYLEASAPRIFAAGDIARWPDPLSGERIRVEHFVVAERQGQTAARNILGHRERFNAVPFFWTEQYDFGLAYVGHATKWDQSEIDGSLDRRDCTITYRGRGKKLAVAVVHRDLDGLRAEVEFERMIASLPPQESKRQKGSQTTYQEWPSTMATLDNKP